MSTVPDDGDSWDDQFYTGGVSQWREYDEDNWKYWDWPPHGWRPSEYHDAYTNKASPYYRYNHYEWKWPVQTPPESMRNGPPKTPSSDEVEHVSQLLRSSTAEMVNRAGQQCHVDVPEPAAELQVAQPAANQNEAKETTAVPQEAAVPAATEQSQKDGTDNGTVIVKDDLTPEEKASNEKKRLAAHARYMRYFRNIRSSYLRH